MLYLSVVRGRQKEGGLGLSKRRGVIKGKVHWRWRDRGDGRVCAGRGGELSFLLRGLPRAPRP